VDVPLTRDRANLKNIPVGAAGKERFVFVASFAEMTLDYRAMQLRFR